MNSSPHNYITVNEILSDVLLIVGDESFKYNSKGYYTSLIQQALSELAFDTYFDQRSDSFDIPNNCRIQMPKGAFNIKNIYLFSGDECDISKSVNVYFKKDFLNSKSGNTYHSMNKGDNFDKFYDRSTSSSTPNGLYFYNVQNGEIMLSSNSKAFEKVFIEYSGVGTDIGEVPFIPMFLRQAVKDWVAVKALQAKLPRVDKADFNMWLVILNEQKSSLGSDFSGTWVDAKSRIRRADDKANKDYKLYMQKMYY